MTRVLLGALPLLVCIAVLPAQDSLKLADGRRLTGEVSSETEARLVFITKLGERLEIDKASIVKERRGRGLARRVEARLEGLAADDVEGLFAVARWAQGERSLRRDAERLARRVLALDPEHVEARALLGHAKLLGVWYLDRASGLKAVREIMKERGLVEHEGGFGSPETVARVETAPKDWVVDEATMLWRPLAEVMRERGCVEHLGEWYGPEEKDVIPDLEQAERLLGLKLKAAGVGETRVIAPFAREGCAQHARELQKARVFFIDTFRPERRSALMRVRAVFWLLRETAHFEAFLDKGKGVLHDARPETMKFSRPTGVMAWDFILQVQSQERGTWRESDVARVGMMLMDNEWTGRVSCPDWLGIASAHLAEIAVYGVAKTWWIAPSRYANQEELRTNEGRTLERARDDVRDDLKKQRTPVMRSLFGKKTNQMTVEDDRLGIVLMSYFLEQRKELFLNYLYGQLETDIAKRFEAVFGHPFEEEEKLFRAWLGL